GPKTASAGLSLYGLVICQPTKRRLSELSLPESRVADDEPEIEDEQVGCGPQVWRGADDKGYVCDDSDCGGDHSGLPAPQANRQPTLQGHNRDGRRNRQGARVCYELKYGQLRLGVDQADDSPTREPRRVQFGQ